VRPPSSERTGLAVEHSGSAQTIKQGRNAMRRRVAVRGAEPIPWRQRTAENLGIGAEAWVSLDGKVAFPAIVVEKDDRHYGVQFEAQAARSGVFRGSRYFFFHDEVRTTPLLACINMVSM
jgi:hypothetical protein